ncbi:Translocation/assembly module TamB [Deinococcus radiodurans]
MLAALPSGPLRGRVGLLPAFGGEVSTPLAPWLAALPPDLRAVIRPGELVARVTADGATVRLHQTLYQNEPLNLSAQANWRGGLRASGLLTRRGLRLPVTYDPAGLRVRGARLDARLLSPVLSGAAGEVGLDLTVPGGTGPGAALDWARATGQARLNVRAQGQAVTGLLALRGGELDGALKAGPLHLTATRGRVRATGDLAGHHLEAAGRLRLPGDLSGLRLNVSGPYLSAAATGDLRALRGTLRLRPQTLGGGPARVVIPAQSFPLRVRPATASLTAGGLTYASGRWSGGLDAAYALWTGELKRAGRVRIVGDGKVLAARPSGPLNGRVGLLPTLSGEVSTDVAPLLPTLPGDLRAALRPGQLFAKVTATGATLRLERTLYQNEPLNLTAAVDWSATSGRGGVRATALLSHPQARVPLRYDRRGLRISGARLTGKALAPLLPGTTGAVNLDLNVPGAALDWARATGRARADLTAQGQQVAGDLRLSGGELDGALKAGPLHLTATRGRVRATGDLAGHHLEATGRLRLPGDLSELRVNVAGPYLDAAATGSLADLRGALRLHGQTLGGGPARVVVPAQSFPLRASATAGRVQVAGLSYAGGRWSGGLDAAYALWTGELKRAGRVRVAGNGKVLAARPSGPLNGRIGLLPTLGGEVSTDVAPLLPTLPGDLRAVLRPGQLFAKVTATGATLRLERTLYQNEPLNLTAAVDWSATNGQRGVRASGLLTHPGTRLPLAYDGRDLRVAGAVLSGRALRPVLPGAAGQARLDLTVPGLDWQRANGQAQVDLTAQGQRAQGRVTLRGGQLSADLASSLGGQAVRVRGPLYPQANATVSLGGVNGTLTGDAAHDLTLRARGRYQERDLDLLLTGHELSGAAARAEVQAALGGAVLTAAARRGAGEGLAAWKTTGRVQVPDLRTFSGTVGSGTAGRLNAALSGTLADLRAEVTGEVAGIGLRAPARFTGGTLRVDDLRATLPAGQGGGTLRASGTLWPQLALGARARLGDVLPGDYAAQLGGTFARPDLGLTGQLGAVNGEPILGGLDVAGTRVSGHLLGRDWKLGLGGERLSGLLRGQLGTGAAGGLLDAGLHLDTRFQGAGRETPLDLGLRGPLTWNARRGWGGSVRVTGSAPGGAVDAIVDGRGVLALAGTLGTGDAQAAVTGTLPAGLPLKPGGTLTLTRLDVGAFWKRPGQLRASGQATLGGAAWNRLTATFNGRLDDAAVELSGDVQASYGAGNAELSLKGEAVQGAATLRSGRYAATLRSPSVALARLLPADFGFGSLNFGGALEAAGTLADGPERLRLRGARLRGTQSGAGPFSLAGSADYSPRTGSLSAELRGSLRGGTLSASGALPGGLNVTVRDVAASYPGAASFGQGTLGGALTLGGPLRDPLVSGQLGGVLSSEQGTFDSRLTLAGHLRRPDVTARVQASGSSQGALYAETRGLDPARPAGATVRVYGSVQTSAGHVQADVQGQWPRLGGALTVKTASLPDPLTLRGDGEGGYALSAGQLGQGQLTLTPGAGLVPTLAGQLRLSPLALVAGAQGEATVTATLGGPLTAPTVRADLRTRAVQAGGAELPDLSGAVSGTLTDLASLSGSFTQAGVGQTGTAAPVARWQGRTLTLSGLNVRVAGGTVAASGPVSLNGTADLGLTAGGALAGQLRARTDHGSLSAAGTLTTRGLTTALDVRRTPYTGWSGSARVTGGPDGVLTEPLALRVSGDANHPLVTGEGGLLGARARIVANTRGAQVRLVDGEGATANGLVELRPDAQGNWAWSGAASLTRPELAFSVTPSGPLADPSLLLTLRRGEWRASGTAGVRAADLRVSDGEREGQVTWNGEQVQAALPGLDLARLGIRGLTGRVTANGAVSRTQDGEVHFQVSDVTAPQTLPLLGIEPAGDLSGTLTLSAGRPSVQAFARLNAGTLTLSAVQQPGVGGAPARWQGQLGGTLRRGDGQFSVDVRTVPGGLSGGAELRAYPLELPGQTVTANGQLKLSGATFSAAATATNTVGSARLSAEGGLADAVPALESLLGVTPTGEGYSARAVLGAVEVADLGLAPGLSGKVYGEANLSDGGGTFFLASDALQVGERRLPLRVEGSQVAGSWRLRGFLDHSDFTAGLSGGEVFGQGTLQALPLGAVLAAVAGSTPGEGVVTGPVRFRFPLADPLAGRASVVAERIRVSARRTENGQTVTETLTGTGTLDYAARELRNINVQLAGAGTWDVRGQYTRQKVDVNARFTDTTFTPVLQLIPSLAGLDPSLKGTVVLSAAGTYDRPRGLLRAENVTGRVAGLTVQLPSFAGDLPDSGAFTAGGRLLTGGSVGSDGQIDVRGQLTLGKLSGTVATFSGLFAPQALGPLPNTTATLRQQGEQGWTLDARSRSTNPVTGAGTLTLSGALTPRWDLNLSARNYNLPVSAIYARESALTGDFRLRDSGDFVRVSGEGDFARLVLGRVDAPTTLPAAPGSTGNGAKDTFVSPLPEEYTTFPKPAAGSGQGKGTTGTGSSTSPATTPLLERFLFEDVQLRASGGIRLDENLARAEFSTPGLVVSGTAARPQVRGQIVSQRGSVFLRDNEFVITQSNVTFSGAGLYPTFTLTARGTVPSPTTRQQVPVALNVTGKFRTTDGLQGVLDLDTRLSCAEPGPQCRNPATGSEYTQAELYALVATGVPDLNNLGSNLAGLGNSALQTALNVFFLGELERTLARGLGVDVLRLTPALGTDGNVNATLTVGSYLTRELFVQYQVDLSGNGLIDATYSTPDGRFTFRVSTPLNGLDLQSVRPNFNVAYNVNPRVSFSVGLQNTAGRSASAGVAAQPESTQLRFGVTYRIGGR